MKRVPYLAIVAGTSLVYIAAAKIGLSVAILAEQVSPVWPPSGIALAAVALFGYGVWPGIWLGAFFINVTSHEPALVAGGIATGNTLEALVAVLLLRRIVHFDLDLERLRDVVGFIVLAAGASTALAASLGVLNLCLGGVQPWAKAGALWSTWWVGDAIGDLVFVPFLLGARSLWKQRWRTSRIGEAAILMTGTACVSFAVFCGWNLPILRSLSAYAVFPFVIWAALRFGPPVTGAAVLMVSVIANWGTVHGLGQFGAMNVVDRLVPLQLFMGVVAVTGLLLAAVISERNTAERRRAADLAVMQVLSESVTLKEAAPRIVQAVCETLGWDLGAVWSVDKSAAVLRCEEVWHKPDMHAHEFVEATRERRFTEGVGLPGRVWRSGRSAWIEDVVRDSNFPRAPSAARAGLHSAFGFPIVLGGETLGVLEFFSRQIRQPDRSVMQMFETIGAQMGQFIGRKASDEIALAAEAERAGLLAREHEAREEAETANRLKDEFIATLSHELRTPLSAILGWAHLLREGGLDEKGIERALETILRNVHAQSQILSDIHDVSRVISGKLDLELETVDLAATIDQVLNTVRPAAQTKNILLAFNRAPQDSSTITGDPRRIEQIMWNLLSNAIKFVPNQGHVNIYLIVAPAFAEIAIEDDGPGIDPAFLPHVFERFRQADSSSSRLHRGLGLGLAIVRHLVEMHGGTIDAHNRVDRTGAVFKVRLPRIPVATGYDRTSPGRDAAVTPPSFAKPAVAAEPELGMGPAAQGSIDRASDMPDPMISRGPSQNMKTAKIRNAVGGASHDAKAGDSDRDGDSAKAGDSAERPTIAVAGETLLGLRVLLVDDDRDARELMTIILEGYGAGVMTAGSAEEAFLCIAETTPHVLIADIEMPHEDGYSLLRRVRGLPIDRGGRIPAVALTAYASPNDRAMALAAGFDTHLAKPVQPEYLASVVAQLAGKTHREVPPASR